MWYQIDIVITRKKTVNKIKWKLEKFHVLCELFHLIKILHFISFYAEEDYDSPRRYIFYFINYSLKDDDDGILDMIKMDFFLSFIHESIVIESMCKMQNLPLILFTVFSCNSFSLVSYYLYESIFLKHGKCHKIVCSKRED